VNRHIEDALRTYIREVYLPRDSNIELGDGENLFESGTMDSAGLISFVGVIEKDFNLSIPDEDLLPEHFMSIGAIAAYIRSRQQVQGEKNLAEIDNVRN
jgi:acyl carrier protein